MKYLYTAIAALLAASSATAQPLQRKTGSFSPIASQPQKEMAVAAQASSNIITQQPNGVLHEQLYRSFCYMIPYQFPKVNGNTYDDYASGLEGKYVEGTDGNVYIYEALTYPTNGAWVKATRGEGDTLLVKKQPIYEEYGVTYYINRLKIDIADDGKWWAADEDSDVLKYILRNDSLILCDDGLVDGYARTMAGLTDADDNWYGYAEWSTVSAPCKQQVNTPPADAKFEDYIMTRYDANDVEYTFNVNFATDNEGNFYIGNFYKNIPDGWIKGHRKDNLVIFPANQYIGFDEINRMHYFFRPVDPEASSIAVMGDSLAYTYDEETRELQTYDKFYINIGNEGLLIPVLDSSPVNYSVSSLKPAEEEVAGVPEPVLFDADYCWPYDENDEVKEGRVGFYLPERTTNDHLINTDKAYYNVYFDDKLYTFRPDTYKYIPYADGLTNVPFTFSDGTDFQVFGILHILYIYEPCDSVSIQVVYEGGGEVNKSEIATYYFTDPSKIDDIVATPSGATEYFDLSGRRVNNPAKGFYVKMQRMEDGTLRSEKVLLK